ncbi:MAG: hypothetical protein JXO22_08015 [Phycisphaerae bacterium]|nr:hypothetical protein [Phycisphaerae bacterium]
MLRNARTLLVPLLAAIVLPAAMAELNGDLRAMGFPFSTGNPSGARPGQWFPILVELQTLGTEHIEVELHCECIDLDGDRIEFVKTVPLTAGDQMRPFWCYGIAHGGGLGLMATSQYPKALEVVDPRTGARLASFDLPTLDFLDNDALLILDISQRAVAHLQTLASNAMPGDPAWGQRVYYSKISVGRMPATNLPDRWFGLETVNVLVWDAPDPLGEQVGQHQTDAVIEWVRNGGQLILGVGANADLLAQTRLAEILPFDLAGGTGEVADLPRFAAEYYRAIEGVRPPGQTIAVARVRTRDDAITLISDELGAGPGPLIAMRTVGSGRVIASAASLRDLMPAGVSSDVYELFIDLNRNTPAFLESEGNLLYQGLTQPARLFDGLISEVEFSTAGQVRALIATLFVFAYIGLSTLASWLWLRHRGRTSWSWGVFAVFAIGASFFSLAAVRASHGLASTVKSVSLVDMVAGEYQARSACWFGYRSSARARHDFSLPPALKDQAVDTDDYLRPMAVGATPSSYATPMRYTAHVEDAQLDDTPLRATLKQFEGYWQGDLDGSINGNLIASRNTGQIEPGSYIANDLRVNLIGGYLLYLDPRLRGVTRPAGTDRCYRSIAGPVPPARNVLAVKLDPIKAGEQLRGTIGAAEARERNVALAEWQRGRELDPKKRPDLVTLWDAQRVWRPFAGSPRFREAGLLASTRDLFLHNSGTDMDKAGRPVTIDGLVDRDITHWLADGQAVLLLFADEPGPATLYRDGRPVQARSGKTLYRVRIPLRYVGTPPRDTDDEDKLPGED